MAKEKEELLKKPSVWDIAKKLNKEFKDKNMCITADTVPEYSRLSTGCFGFDYPLFGGLPLGRIVKGSGLQHSGKTTGACLTVAAYQQQFPDKMCVYVDVEHSLDLKFQAKENHLQLDKLIYINPPAGTCGEDILQMILEYQQADDIGVIVLDSIPALVPKAVLEKDMTEDAGMRATMAKKLYPFLAIMSGMVKEKGNIFYLINQVRETAGAMPGTIKYVEPGGKAPEFYSSVCIRYGTRTFTLGDNMDACKKEDGLGADGFRLKYKITKNKTAPQNRAGGFITYRYGTGVDKLNDLLEIALKFDFIRRLSNVTYQLVNLKTGEIYTDEDGNLLQASKKDLIEYLRTHPEFQEEYIKMLTAYISSDDLNTGSLLSADDVAEINAQEAAVARSTAEYDDTDLSAVEA